MIYYNLECFGKYLLVIKNVISKVYNKNQDNEHEHNVPDKTRSKIPKVATKSLFSFDKFYDVSKLILFTGSCDNIEEIVSCFPGAAVDIADPSVT